MAISTAVRSICAGRPWVLGLLAGGASRQFWWGIDSLGVGAARAQRRSRGDWIGCWPRRYGRVIIIMRADGAFLSCLVFLLLKCIT